MRSPCLSVFSSKSITMTDEPFKVIIVGASVAGLTLAHCLDRLGVSFEIFDRCTDLAPQIGATLGIMPNGARILDQLGLFEGLEGETSSCTRLRFHFHNGLTFESDALKDCATKFGYAPCFVERQRVLQVLYERFRRDERVHVNKKIVSADQDELRATIQTADGCQYHADLVVGADGLHSIVRSEIWRYHIAMTPNTLLGTKPTTFGTEYVCVWGISTSVVTAKDWGHLDYLDHELAIHVLHGLNKTLWFLSTKCDQVYSYPARPRFTIDDAAGLCSRLVDKQIDADLTFGALWSRCEVFQMTPLEMGYSTIWHHGRLVCIGDALRKVAPVCGQGANMAIVDAANLANILWRSSSSHRSSSRAQRAKLSVPAITAQFASRGAKLQTTFLVRTCQLMTRIQTLGGPIERAYARHVLPLVDTPALISHIIAGAPTLEFLELPARSLTSGWRRKTPWWAPLIYPIPLEAVSSPVIFVHVLLAGLLLLSRWLRAKIWRLVGAS
ncbi:hypothetical protein F4778DRAFT_706603 [Xylariomycetidae sp. FL2044]|nr:hypothetical protein F4778DRAFT_706603 [Xylariomycetidae sp. FL2044]